MVAELPECGVGSTPLHENLDTIAHGGKLVFHVLAALSAHPRADHHRNQRSVGTAPPPAATTGRILANTVPLLGLGQ